MGGTGPKAGRRVVSVTAMLVGALVGALFVVHAQIVYPLVIALAIVTVIAAISQLFARSDPASARARG